MLEFGYHKEPVAAGSITKLQVLMKSDKTFLRIHKSWMIIGQTDRDTDRPKSKAFCDCIYET